jgi:arylsulfatase A-like enzyme
MNILLVVSDQERSRGWLPSSVSLPWRERLMSEGIDFTNHWTHSSPCSPSRATMMTGQYVPRHGVVDNCIFEHHVSLDTATPTVGSVLREAGYRSSYIGKWHLTVGPNPPMEAYGYSDWEGNDRHFMGWAGTGVAFDPVIADSAAAWLRANAASSQPWFLTVALVNPHDVMWFPIDQPEWRSLHPEALDVARALLESSRWKDDETLPAYARDYPNVVDSLPENFHDDLYTKPDTHRAWRWSQQHGIWGYIDPADKEAWLRHLDYYVELHRLADESLGVVLSALEDVGAWDDTAVIFTSDHGDMCGSHGLRSKGPFVYDEIMRVPMHVRVPGVTAPGSSTDALSSHVDLANTICGLAGVEPDPAMQGVDLLATDSTPRDHVLFAHDSAHTKLVQQTRYAIRGMFDGRYKYARYYGIGGGKPGDDPFYKNRAPKQYGVDADFDDQDHELYDLQEDPHELVNLANDPARRNDIRARFELLKSLEATNF